jgi:chromosomal replication initiator protein
MTLEQLAVTSTHIEDIVAGDLAPEPRRVPLRAIIRVVCDYYGVSDHEIMSDRRERDASLARQVVMYLAKTLTPLSSCTIGRLLRRDDSSIRSGGRKIEDRLAAEPALRRDLALITSRLV